MGTVKACGLAWLPPLAENARSPVMASYQKIVALAAQADIHAGAGWRNGSRERWNWPAIDNVAGHGHRIRGMA